jgi:hypothetical protein
MSYASGTTHAEDEPSAPELHFNFMWMRFASSFDRRQLRELSSKIFGARYRTAKKRLLLLLNDDPKTGYGAAGRRNGIRAVTARS